MQGYLKLLMYKKDVGSTVTDLFQRSRGHFKPLEKVIYNGFKPAVLLQVGKAEQAEVRFAFSVKIFSVRPETELPFETCSK